MSQRLGSVVIGDGVVTIHHPGQSDPILARILGDETSCGWRTLWLDRLVHRPHDSAIGLWDLSGASTSILRCPTGAAAV